MILPREFVYNTMLEFEKFLKTVIDGMLPNLSIEWTYTDTITPWVNTDEFRPINLHSPGPKWNLRLSLFKEEY